MFLHVYTIMTILHINKDSKDKYILIPQWTIDKNLGPVSLANQKALEPFDCTNFVNETRMF